MAKKIPGFRLVARTLNDSEPSQFVIRQHQTNIGSDEGNDFVIHGGSASRHHASIRLDRRKLEITDLRSTNGTFVNGVRITGTVSLGPGDEIRFGARSFFLLNPVGISGTVEISRSGAKVGKLRTATELVLIAFVIGFGIAQYLAYRLYHEQNKLLLAKAMPLPRVETRTVPAIAAKPLERDSKAIEPANPAPPLSSSPETPRALSSSEMPSAPDVLAAAIALVRLVPDSGQRAGETARDFSLHDSGGNLVSLSKYRGKIVFLNFWATWCGACRGEMTSLESLYREFKDRQDFELLTVSVDQQGWSAISPFLKVAGYDIPVLSDSDSRVSSAYQVSGIPATFIIGRNGRIVWNCAGGLDWSNDSLKSALKGLFTAS